MKGRRQRNTREEKGLGKNRETRKEEREEGREGRENNNNEHNSYKSRTSIVMVKESHDFE